MTFTKEGTYTFNINETVPQTQAGGMTYDSHTAQVTIVVTRDTKNIGKLKAEVTYNNGAASDVTDSRPLLPTAMMHPQKLRVEQKQIFLQRKHCMDVI